MKTVPSLEIRRIRAAMELKWLGLADLARLAGVPMSTASSILNGKLNSRPKLKLLASVVRKAPTPTEVPA